MKTKICAVALAIAAAAPAIADDFTYVSGGFLSQFHSKKHAFSTTVDKKGESKVKNNAFGFYLNGSLGINDYFFVEGRLHHNPIEQQVLLGIGAHYPVAQWANLYALAGIVKRDVTSRYQKEDFVLNSKKGLTITTVSNPKGLTDGYSDSIRPTVELGAKLRINEEMGARVSYRYAQFANKLVDSKYKHLHEVHLGGYHQVAENLAAEVGYNFTHLLEKKKDHKITAGIRYSF